MVNSVVGGGTGTEDEGGDREGPKLNPVDGGDIDRVFGTRRSSEEGVGVSPSLNGITFSGDETRQASLVGNSVVGG